MVWLLVLRLTALPQELPNLVWPRMNWELNFGCCDREERIMGKEVRLEQERKKENRIITYKRICLGTFNSFFFFFSIRHKQFTCLSVVEGQKWRSPHLRLCCTLPWNRPLGRCRRLRKKVIPELYCTRTLTLQWVATMALYSTNIYHYSGLLLATSLVWGR